MWVADVVKGRFMRVKEGGEVTETIEIEGHAIAPILGGEDGRTLYGCITPGFQREVRKTATDASIVAVKVDVPAAGLP